MTSAASLPPAALSTPTQTYFTSVRVPWAQDQQSFDPFQFRYFWTALTLLTKIPHETPVIAACVEMALSSYYSILNLNHLHNIGKRENFHPSSVQFTRSVMSDSLRPHEPQHARPPCPSPTPGVYPNSCPLNRWCHPTISFSTNINNKTYH